MMDLIHRSVYNIDQHEEAKVSEQNPEIEMVNEQSEKKEEIPAQSSEIRETYKSIEEMSETQSCDAQSTVNQSEYSLIDYEHEKNEDPLKSDIKDKQQDTQIPDEDDDEVSESMSMQREESEAVPLKMEEEEESHQVVEQSQEEKELDLLEKMMNDAPKDAVKEEEVVEEGVEESDEEKEAGDKAQKGIEEKMEEALAQIGGGITESIYAGKLDFKENVDEEGLGNRMLQKLMFMWGNTVQRNEIAVIRSDDVQAESQQSHVHVVKPGDVIKKSWVVTNMGKITWPRCVELYCENDE